MRKFYAPTSPPTAGTPILASDFVEITLDDLTCHYCKINGTGGTCSNCGGNRWNARASFSWTPPEPDPNLLTTFNR